MGATDLVASTVMDASASLLNDTAKSVYTYARQLPYLNMALGELQEYFELNNIPVTQETSAVIEVVAGVTEISSITSPALPSNLTEIQQIWERQHGVDPYIPMFRKDYLPHNLEGIEMTQLVYWTFNGQKLNFLAANQDNDIKLDYIIELFSDLVDENSQINIINGKTFLQYRTASLCAEFIERNLTSASGLNQYAVLAIDRATGISVKGKQVIMARRRPFRQSFKRRGWAT